MTSEWERLETVKKQRLYQIIEYESMELANFEDWLFQNTVSAPDSYVSSGSYAIKRASNLLNRLSISSKDDIIVELVRIKWKKSYYNREYDAKAGWSVLLRKVPFPYERTFDPGMPSENWLKKIAACIRNYHYYEIGSPEDLEGWAIGPKQQKNLFNMIRTEMNEGAEGP